jgi:hypothetical protein
MLAPHFGEGVHRTVETRRALWGGLALASVAAAALASDPAGPAPEGPLVVELHFGEEADLDLYVTDPARETIYFANTPSSASGGVLEADARCGAPLPRVEAVRFADPPPGPYRVGVDFPERCGRLSGPVSFRVRVLGSGETREHSGEISLGELQPAVIDFER